MFFSLILFPFLTLGTCTSPQNATKASGPSISLDSNASRCETAVAFYMDNNWSPRTGLVYTCQPEKVRSSDDCVNGMFHWYKGIPGGYGSGMGDCALIEGTVLAGMADKWQVLKNKRDKQSLKAQADKIARGLFNLAELHGIKGFVARGICADDGKSICSLSSIDQYTHWEHSLWRYAQSGMASREMLEEYKKLVVEVAQFMEERVIEENGYNFGLADGTIPDPRGICTMWGPDKKPHAAARLPMLYCATYIATGDDHWREMYEKYIDQALQMTVVLKKLTEQQVRGYMPCYSLYQAMCSLELILSYEKNPERVALIKECMAEFSRRAHLRLTAADPSKPPYGMCWDGELLLTELMDPSYVFKDEDKTFFDEAMLRKEPLKMGWCRAAHLYSVYWKYYKLNNEDR